jgi:hypothetical protein
MRNGATLADALNMSCCPPVEGIMRTRVTLPSVLALLVAIPGCTTFHLYEQTGVLPIQKQRGATGEILAVCEFTYEAMDSGDTPLEASDLQRWQSIVVMGMDQANIFADVVSCSGGEIPEVASYVLNGRIERFRFQKNWVPIFFPLHLGLSFFTFTGYTLFGGPTTVTIVRFAVKFELRKADTHEIVLSLNKNYRSTRAVNVYSNGVENPYDNPNLVFAEILGSTAMSIASALPEEPEHSPGSPPGPPSDLPPEPPPNASLDPTSEP